MNIALPALVLFLLLLPGFMARSRVKYAERTFLDYSPFGQVVTEAVMWALVLHLCWVAGMTWMTPWRVRPDVVLALLSANPAEQTRAFAEVTATVGSIALYFTTLLGFSYLGPMAVRSVIQWQKLDRHDAPWRRFLRFDGAPWYYLLSGADFPKGDEPDCILVSAVVDIAGEAYLYTGILDEYFLDQDGNLDRLVLQQVMRRPFAKDKQGNASPLSLDARFYAVDGDYFVLRYAEAITLNIEYIQFAVSEDDGVADAR